MAMGDERTHAARLGKRQRLSVVRLACLWIKPIRVARDITEQMQGMGRKPRLRRRRLHRTVSQTVCVIWASKPETGAAQGVVGGADEDDKSLVGLTFQQLLALPDPVHRFPCFTQLRQHPGGGDKHDRKLDDKIPGPDYLSPGFDQRACLRPLTLEQVEHSRATVCLANGECMTSRLGEPECLG